MARPCKKRRICQLPRCTAFRPQGTSERPTVRLTLEEFECLRLMDYEGLTQAACAAQLGVARTTAQALYQSARARARLPARLPFAPRDRKESFP